MSTTTKRINVFPVDIIRTWTFTVLILSVNLYRLIFANDNRANETQSGRQQIKPKERRRVFDFRLLLQLRLKIKLWNSTRFSQSLSTINHTQPIIMVRSCVNTTVSSETIYLP